ASTVWGYERARAIIGLTWGTPSLEGYFINADIAVFGGNPSEWMQAIHHPVLTEYLQMAYLTYFLLPLILCLTLIYAGRWRVVPYVLFMTILGTHQNFIWYMLVPVRSPFLVADTADLGHLVGYDFELTGIWFTESLRQS